jgi:hypothetical protein
MTRTADPIPSLLAAGFTPEEARKACNVIAEWLEKGIGRGVSPTAWDGGARSARWNIAASLRAAGGGQ